MRDDWKDRWRLFLTHAVSADEIVEHCLRLIGEACGQDSVDRLQPAKEDFLALTNVGANPRIVIGILLSKGDFRMSPDILGDAFFERDAELAALSSPRYWTSILSKLAGSQKALRRFMATDAYRRIEAHPARELEAQIRPFSRICKEVQNVESSVATLMQSIRDHRLDQPDTSLKDLGLAVAITKTSGKKGPKKGSGVPRSADYTTLSLNAYFRKRTRRPNTRILGRLLHFAGLDQFPHLATASEGAKSSGAAMDEVNRLRKRIAYLRRDRELFASATLGLSFRESDYETRDPVDFGGGIWIPF